MSSPARSRDRNSGRSRNHGRDSSSYSRSRSRSPSRDRHSRRHSSGSRPRSRSPYSSRHSSSSRRSYSRPRSRSRSRDRHHGHDRDRGGASSYRQQQHGSQPVQSHSRPRSPRHVQRLQCALGSFPANDRSLCSFEMTGVIGIANISSSMGIAAAKDAIALSLGIKGANTVRASAIIKSRFGGTGAEVAVEVRTDMDVQTLLTADRAIAEEVPRMVDQPRHASCTVTAPAALVAVASDMLHRRTSPADKGCTGKKKMVIDKVNSMHLALTSKFGADHYSVVNCKNNIITCEGGIDMDGGNPYVFIACNKCKAVKFKVNHNNIGKIVHSVQE